MRGMAWQLQGSVYGKLLILQVFKHVDDMVMTALTSKAWRRFDLQKFVTACLLLHTLAPLLVYEQCLTR